MEVYDDRPFLDILILLANCNLRMQNELKDVLHSFNVYFLNNKLVLKCFREPINQNDMIIRISISKINYKIRSSSCTKSEAVF